MGSVLTSSVSDEWERRSSIQVESDVTKALLAWVHARDRSVEKASRAQCPVSGTTVEDVERRRENPMSDRPQCLVLIVGGISCVGTDCELLSEVVTSKFDRCSRCVPTEIT